MSLPELTNFSIDKKLKADNQYIGTYSRNSLPTAYASKGKYSA